MRKTSRFALSEGDIEFVKEAPPTKPRHARDHRPLHKVADEHQAKIDVFRGLGDVEGHPFHGNQWTEGGGSFTPTAEEAEIVNDWAWPNSNPGGNDYERLRNPKTPEGKRMTEILNNLPVHDGVTYRGIALDKGSKEIERLVSAKGYEMKLHSSSSKERSTAEMFLDSETFSNKQGVLLELHGRGRDINPHLPEDLQWTTEVVMTAGTKYRFEGLSHEKIVTKDSSGPHPTTVQNIIRIKLKEVR